MPWSQTNYGTTEIEIVDAGGDQNHHTLYSHRQRIQRV